ncbi:MAG: FtsW/RodA/SpoVE family cell cycle protein [Oscillospiraceae bacterium]|nr:FtsW/RodA/SpoVE family cell cycle protein [Oscillospiraceae bacterium]
MFLFTTSLISTIYGIILISSVVRNTGSGGREVYVQIGALVVGVILFVIFSYLDIDIIADKSGFLLFFSVLFIFTLFFWGVGREETGNRAWLRFFDIGIQPAEVTKVTFIIIIAKMSANQKERKTHNSFVSLLQIILVFLLMVGLIVVISSDLGSALVYGFIFLAMMFVAGVKLRWFALGGGLIAVMFPFILNNFLTEGQKNRILAIYYPEQIDPTRRNVLWQTDNSIKAITTGGFRGQGLGNGRITQAGVIPEQRTDFIFSAAGEELGFIGCMLIVILLIAIIIRCIYVGIKSNNPLGLLVCTGVAAMLLAQTFENIGMCLGLLPVIGLTLPFFSYGGSSVVACFAAIGIVSGVKMRPKPVRFRTT